MLLEVFIVYKYLFRGITFEYFQDSNNSFHLFDTIYYKTVRNKMMIIISEFKMLTITSFNINIDAHFDPAERLSLGHRHLHVKFEMFFTINTKYEPIFSLNHI